MTDTDPVPVVEDEDRPERPEGWREAYEDMRERERRLEERNADWLRGFHKRYGGSV